MRFSDQDQQQITLLSFENIQEDNQIAFARLIEVLQNTDQEKSRIRDVKEIEEEHKDLITTKRIEITDLFKPMIDCNSEEKRLRNKSIINNMAKNVYKMERLKKIKDSYMVRLDF